MPRVAYFPDSFHEVNGVAHTSRNFAAWAQRHHIPMVCVRAGQTTQVCAATGTVRALELGRSWHTNVHEYAGRRMRWLSRHLGPWGRNLERHVEAGSLAIASHFYQRASVLYAPNSELCALLERTTQRTCHLMQRGVDTDLFTPARRTRPTAGGKLILGYVGRLSVEKNVSLLPRIDRALQLHAPGLNVQWLIIGHGAEEPMLRAQIPAARLVDGKLAGVLRGDRLADAYAGMDLLVFPSHTDTFGNVVLEALASGVPALVTPDGGPAHILRDHITGRIVRETGSAPDEGFASAILQMLSDPNALATMRRCARHHAQQYSWDAVFERVVAAYPTSRQSGS